MATIRSLSESFGVLKRNPVVFAAGLLYAVIILPQTALSLLGIPFVPRLLQALTFFVTPFVFAGLLGMVYEGRVRSTDFGTFTKLGKAKYVSVLAGNLIQTVISFVFFVVTFFVMLFVVGLSFSAAQGASESVLSSIGIVTIAIFGVLVLVFLLVMFFLQFYAPAIVADNVGALEGYKRSVGVVKRNFVETLGFGVLNLVLSALLVLPAVALVVLSVFGASALGGAAGAGAGEFSSTAGSTAGTGLSLVMTVGVLVYSFLTTTLMTPFRAAFSVAFYDNHRPSEWQ